MKSWLIKRKPVLGYMILLFGIGAALLLTTKQAEHLHRVERIIKIIEPIIHNEKIVIIGKTGPQGKQGAVGPRGAKGLVGPRGANGRLGGRGPAGRSIRGPIGPRGPAGSQGIQGLRGIPGPQGPVGPSGSSGAPGLQGNEGNQGHGHGNGGGNEKRLLPSVPVV